MKPVSPNTLRNAVVVFLVVGILFLAISGFLRPVLGVVMDPFVTGQRWLSERFMAVYDFFTLPRDVTTLISRNTELEDEVANLQSQIIQLQEQLREADILYSLLDYARSRPADKYVAAAVIGRDPSPFMQYIIIDNGSDDGIRYGMPVVTKQGLVGRVDAVTAGASRVQLISDSRSRVNVTMQRQDEDAIISGSITGDITLEMLNQNISLQVGDIMLTSGLGGTYPADILIGQVVDLRKTENELFQSAYVQPAVDFTTLRAVLVITNFQSTNINPLIPQATP